jgi:hypothetical protein
MDLDQCNNYACILNGYLQETEPLVADHAFFIHEYMELRPLELKINFFFFTGKKTKCKLVCVAQIYPYF